MKSNRIKILSVGENCEFVKKFRTESIGIEYYTFVQTDFDSFPHVHNGYDVLFFVFKKETINTIISLFSNTNFIDEPPVILICDDNITEDDVLSIPFKNKLVFKSTTAFEDIRFNISVIIKKTELEKKINDFESRVGSLHDEIETLKGELDNNRLNIEELSQTNYHLVSATWREREVKKKILFELESIKKENEFNKINISELSSTNEHLISATWRERDLKKQLKEAMEDLQNSKNLIEKQSKKISESINYSRRIQNVILPDENIVKNDLKESFILYIPKDIISGDFPFYYKNDNAIYLAAVDCTGHGVPGAMLSLIGNLALNDIVSDPENRIPSSVLKKLNSTIIKILKQDIEGNDTSDGMDIALCVIDLKDNILRYSGAHRPLYRISGNNFFEYKGTRLPIGGRQYKKEILYIEYEIDILPGDQFYIFSDGFPDQFGGSLKKKYGYLRIQNYLLDNRHLSMDAIKEGLKKEFMYWRAEDKQMDDILFIGFKF